MIDWFSELYRIIKLISYGGTSKKLTAQFIGALNHTLTTSGEGSFPSSNVARVDPSGDNDTGTIGDLSKPFATIQAAVDAFEDDPPAYPIIQVGNYSSTETVTTSLPILAIIGDNGESASIKICQDLILTNTNDAMSIILRNVAISTILIYNNTAFQSYFYGCIVDNLQLNGTTDYYFTGEAYNSCVIGALYSTTASSFSSTLMLINSISLAGGDVYLKQCVTGSILADNIHATDTFIDGGVTGNFFQSDWLVNPINFDFSTLPTAQPSTVGKAWIDTTAGANIVKVKL